MALFQKKAKTHADIVAPLKDMAETLANHVLDQQDSISRLTDEKKKIDDQITFSQGEIEKSNNTVEQIKKMIDLPKISSKELV